MNSQLDGLTKNVMLPRPHRRGAPWVAIAGAKGGVGKTTLSVNLAILMAKAGYRTLLADLDPGCGDIGVHLRLAGRKDLDDAAAGDCSLREAVIDGPVGISVLLGKTGSTHLLGGDSAALSAMLDQLDEIAGDFDVVIADTGAGIGPATIAVTERAELVLAVTTVDAPALTDTYALTKVLHRRGQPLPHLVINRTRSHDDGARAAQKLTAVTQKFLGAPLPLCAWVCDDGLLELSVSDQRPLALFGQGPAMEDLRGLCASVLAALPGLRRRRAPTPTPTPRLRPALR
ncbi:MAG: AAA family ATPase [Planctomycetes bacterium]|nr:AAA family ATPase [Planctomycetota bacterium]